MSARFASLSAVLLLSGSAFYAEEEPTAEVRRINAGSAVLSVALAPDGKTALFGTTRGKVGLWDLKTGKERLLGRHEESVWSVAFSPDGRLACSGAGSAIEGPSGRESTVLRFHDCSARLWDVKTGKVVHRRDFHGEVRAVCFSPSGRQAALGVGCALVLWDVENGKVIRDKNGAHSLRITSLCFSPDGKRLLSAGRDAAVRLWDVEDGKELLALKGHKHNVNGVAFFPDGEKAVSCSGGGWPALDKVFDCAVRVWDLKTGREVLHIEPGKAIVHAVAVTRDGKRLLTGHGDGTMRVWDAQTGKELQRFRHCADPSQAVTSVCLAPDGRLALSGSEEGSVRLWKLPE